MRIAFVSNAFRKYVLPSLCEKLTRFEGSIENVIAQNLRQGINEHKPYSDVTWASSRLQSLESDCLFNSFFDLDKMNINSLNSLHITTSWYHYMNNIS